MSKKITIIYFACFFFQSINDESMDEEVQSYTENEDNSMFSDSSKFYLFSNKVSIAVF